MVKHLEDQPTVQDIQLYIIISPQYYMERSNQHNSKKTCENYLNHKKRITEEKQDGDGKIQTGKSQITFNLYIEVYISTY